MMIRKRADAKSGALRQRECRARKKLWESQAAARYHTAEHLHQSVCDADAEGVELAWEFKGETPLETMDKISQYYLMKAQELRLERFALAAGNKKPAAPRVRKAAG
jgi:hypothetical protein